MPPEPSAVTPRDIFLAAHLSAEAATGFLEGYGLRDGAAADEHLQQLAEDLSTRLALGNLAELLFDTLATTPDPDAAASAFAATSRRARRRPGSSATCRPTRGCWRS